MTQAELDVLSDTFIVTGITQSRGSTPVNTTVTAGPYNAGSTSIAVTSVIDIYQGAFVSFLMDNAALFTVQVTGVSGSTLSLASAVPAGRNVPNNANVYLYSDIEIEFFEQAACTASDVTITVV